MSRPRPRHIYSYDNLASQRDETCGQAAIATMLDYFGRAPFNLPRVVEGHDGQLHFDNTAFVGAITKLYPPENFLVFKCSPPELVVRALRGFGLNAQQVVPPDGDRGAWARGQLESWLARTGYPLLTLIDLPTWIPEARAYALHWAVIYACGARGVSLASWHENHQIDWSIFMRSWHCEGVPLTHLQYLQIHVWP